jgi:tRNA threonylcarbamoyl adenosine modification protein YjeE
MRTWSTDVADEAGTRAVARALAAALTEGDTVLLEGELGAGKTSFARELAYGLGLDEDEPVTSPTFALAHEYEIGPSSRLLVHADLYRLSHADELLEIGLDGVLGTSAIALIEWGERFSASIPGVAVVVTLTVLGETARRIAFRSTSDRGEALLGVVRRSLPGESTP